MIRQGLGSIKPTGFDKVIVTSRAIGSGDAWSEQWELVGGSAGDRAPAPAPLPSKPAVKTLASSEPPTAWYKKSWLIATSIISGLVLLSFFIQDKTPTPTITVQESQQELSVDEPAEVAQVEAPPPPPVVDRTFADAVNQAIAASEASQAAASKDDWDNVASLWNAAISQMKNVPASNANYAMAQLKASEYQQNLDYAEERSIALLPNLGVNKSDLRYAFSQQGVDFLFKDAPLTDGTPRLLGTSPDNLVMMELYGSTNLVTKATMMTFIGQGVPADLLALYNVTFLDKVAPGYNWNAQLSETLSELSASNLEDFSEKENFRAGDKIVSVSLSEISGIVVLLVSVEPD